MIWKWFLQNLGKLDLKVYLFFLVITSFLWLMMKLSDNYNKNIELKISFTEIPSGSSMVSSSDTIIKLYVSAEGYKLISFSGNKNQTIKIPLKSVKFSKYKEKKQIGVINGPTIRSLINSQLDIMISDKNIQPESIKVIIEPLDTVELPVKLDATISTVAGYRPYNEPQLNPAIIKVTGPKSIVDTLKYIQTEPAEFSKLSNSKKQKLNLENPNRLCTLSATETTVNIEIVEFIDAEIEVPIKIISHVPSLQVKTFPSTVKIRYQVAMPDYKLIIPNQFIVTVDIDSLSALRHSSLIPNLIKYPPGIENVKLNTEKIDFIINQDD